MLIQSIQEVGIDVDEDARLSSAEAARRLGVKIETLYAYVSRGLLPSRRVPGGRGSTFAVADVERLARAGSRARAGAAEPFRFPAISTRVTLVRDGELFYRGQDAVALSAERSFEEIAGWLWGGDGSPRPFGLPAGTAAAVHRAVVAVPAAADRTTVLRVALATAAALDPLRHDLRPDAVRQTARLAIAAMVEGLSATAAAGCRAPGPDAPVAERLLAALAPGDPGPGALDCLQAGLILLADHGLAASTVAARVVASARADPYSVIGGGLGALDSPLHGAASTAARALLIEVAGDAAAGPAVLARLRSGQRIPGLGHALYPLGDPRATALLGMLGALPAAAPWLAAARNVECTLAGGRAGPADRANVDLALAVLMLATGMPADAGEAIFAVARVVGWIAHALEEYREEPLRWRGRELYVGPDPASIASTVRPTR